MADNWVFIAGDGSTKTMAATEISSGIFANQVRVADATAAHFLPTMDAAARSGFVKVSDGTGSLGLDNSNTTAKVSLYGKVSAAGDTALPAFNTAAHAGYVVVTDLTNTMPTMDAVGRAGYVFVTNGTQTMPSMDALARPGFVRLSDGTNALMPASASLADAFANPSTTKIEALLGVFNGATWDRLRTANVFTTVALNAGTSETTIWTPASGKKFRLLGFLLTCGAASTLTFKDNTAGTTIFVTRGTTDAPINTGPMGNGILSASADNVLTVTRGTSCTLSGTLFGCEE